MDSVEEYYKANIDSPTVRVLYKGYGPCPVELDHRFVEHCSVCGYSNDKLIVQEAVLRTIDVIDCDDDYTGVGLDLALDCLDLPPELVIPFLVEMHKHVESGHLTESLSNGVPYWFSANDNLNCSGCTGYFESCA